MKEEVEVAAAWWTKQLRKSLSHNPSLLESFHNALEAELLERYEGHWYEGNAPRGSGYRSISYDHRMDTVLRRAAKRVGIETLPKLLSHCKNQIMFVNPGEVKVKNGALMTAAARPIYTRDSKKAADTNDEAFVDSSKDDSGESPSPDLAPQEYARDVINNIISRVDAGSSGATAGGKGNGNTDCKQDGNGSFMKGSERVMVRSL